MPLVLCFLMDLICSKWKGTQVVEGSSVRGDSLQIGVICFWHVALELGIRKKIGEEDE